MKVLTVKNPWACWIIHGYKSSSGILYKDIENRTWKTNYRGKILIHASKYPCDTRPRLNGVFTDADFLRAIVYETPSLNGMIIGSAELLDCVTNSQSVWAEPDMWHWVLGNPKPLWKPVPAKGFPGLWEYSDD
jgi:hypothetical protein